MIKVVAKNFADKSKIDEILKLYKELVELTRNEDGCIKYELFQDERDSSILCMIEEWESRDALDRHLKSEHFNRIVPKIKKFMIKDTELNVYNKLI